MEIPLPESFTAKFHGKWKNNQAFYNERQCGSTQRQQDHHHQPSHRFLPSAQSTGTQLQRSSKIVPPAASATPTSVITSTASAARRHAWNEAAGKPDHVQASRSSSKTFLDHGGSALVVKPNQQVVPVAARTERIYCDCCDEIFIDKASFQQHIKAVYDARPHACDQCPQRFKVPAALRRHALIHSGERPYSCTVCGKSFNQSGSLKGHMRVHTGERPYECKYCEWTFSNSSNLLKHERKHQLDEQQQTLQGIVTHHSVRRRRVRQPWVTQSQQFQRQLQMDQQLQQFNQRQEKQQQYKQQQQRQLQQSGYQEMLQQYSDHHSSQQKTKMDLQIQQVYHQEDTSNAASTSSYNNQNEFLDVSCEIEVPQSPEDLSQHLPTPPKLKPKPDFVDVKPPAKRLKRSASDTLLDLRRLPDDVNISQLSRVGIQQQSFKIEPTDEQNIVIPNVTSSFRPLPFLKKAVVNPIPTLETKAEVFACDQCPRWFPTKARMKTHLASHTDERPYDCVYCGKKFKSTYALRRHIMIHEGIKPYQCSLCFKSFNQTGSLTLHMRTHTGERPYTCHFPACTARFSNSSNLSKHVKLHGAIPTFKPNPSAAVSSSEGFSDMIANAERLGATWMDVVREENESHVTPVYSCDQCDYSTKSAKTLAEHKVVYHDQ